MKQVLMNIEQAARIIYGLDDTPPTKSQKNTVAGLCRSGKLDATKAGRRWVIRMTFDGNNAEGDKR